MSLVTCHVSISLDGFIAGPDQSLENPIGVGGLKLHQWHFDSSVPTHEGDVAARDDLMRTLGAVIMGRNMYGPIRGEWDADWRGWWGDDPPYHSPVFVLTHYPHEPIEMDGGTTFHFVTDGFDAALDAGAGRGGRRRHPNFRRRLDDPAGIRRRRDRRNHARHRAGAPWQRGTAVRRR